MRLQPYIYGTDPSAFYFTGSVTIDVECISVTNVITLHVDRLEIAQSDVSVRQMGGNAVTVDDITYDAEPHFYNIHLNQNLVVGRQYQIEFSHFRG